MTTETISGITLTTKANVYFVGKCISHGFTLADGTKKSAGVVLPSLVIFGLMAMPYLDFNKKAAGFQGYSLGPEGGLTTAHYQVCSRPVNSDAHMSNLLLLMAQRMGVEVDQFGDSNKVISL